LDDSWSDQIYRGREGEPTGERQKGLEDKIQKSIEVQEKPPEKS